MSEISRRLGRVELIEKLSDATCLDLRCKKHAFVNHQAAEETEKRVTAAAAGINRTESQEEIPPDSGAVFWEDFDERVASLRASATTSNISEVMMEKQAYLAEPLLPSDPLAWWRKYSPVYKSLSDVMKPRLLHCGQTGSAHPRSRSL